MSGRDLGWFRVCRVDDVPPGGSVAVRTPAGQVALFRLQEGRGWRAIGNRCPHWDEEVLWRGLVEEDADRETVACPMHKKRFSLGSGACLAGDVGPVPVYDLRIVDGWVEIDLARSVDRR